jgi:hypothetical protein
MIIRTIEEAKAFRRKIESAAQHLPVEEAVNSAELFPKWDSNKAYNKGERFTYNGNLYECIEANPVNPTWTPDVTYTYYKPIANVGEEGTLDNPITAVAGMEYITGLYYQEGEDIYLCERIGVENGISFTLHYLPSALVGQYFSKL